MNNDCHSILVNVPLSSPLHPQVNLPFLKGFLAQHGFKAKVCDANIRFFHWMLNGEGIDLRCRSHGDDPVMLIGFYNEIEAALARKCGRYPGLTMDLRGISLAYDRVRFDDVLKAVEDTKANPFIEFSDELLDEQFAPANPRIIGIGITFQDQVIAGFTLAARIRKKMPDTQIVLGGQMITRCYDTMLEAGTLNRFWDYLVCWDGELPLLELHERIIRRRNTPLNNVIVGGSGHRVLDRKAQAFDLDQVVHPDFSDLDFNMYLFPDLLIPLETARGCYGKCEFCAIPSGSNYGFRERSVEKIIGDILDVQAHTEKKYGRKATYFKFMDDTSSPRTLIALAQQIESRGIDAKWETFARLDKPFDDIEVMRQLYRGGCRKLMWGLETNDPELLKSMDKKISPVSSGKVLDAAHKAGILNFVFVLLGFPGETDEQRERLADFIIAAESIHVLTVATFDVTKRSRIQADLAYPNEYGLLCEAPKDFEVRLPYTINGENWKKHVVRKAQEFLVKITKSRPDIGFMSLFPDQVRGILSDCHGNTWGKTFLAAFGEDKIRNMLLATEGYIGAFDGQDEMDLAGLPEPIKREHRRTREDIDAIAEAIRRRRKYETKRMDSI